MVYFLTLMFKLLFHLRFFSHKKYFIVKNRHSVRSGDLEEYSHQAIRPNSCSIGNSVQSCKRRKLRRISSVHSSYLIRDFVNLGNNKKSRAIHGIYGSWRSWTVFSPESGEIETRSRSLSPFSYNLYALAYVCVCVCVHNKN